MIQAEIKEGQAWMREFFSRHRELTPEEKAERVVVIRSIAERSRVDAEARSYMEWLTEQVGPDLPMEVQAFRACYLDGVSRPTSRQVGRARSMDKRSVHRCIRRTLEAMLPLAFGLDGLYAADKLHR